MMPTTKPNTIPTTTAATAATSTTIASTTVLSVSASKATSTKVGSMTPKELLRRSNFFESTTNNMYNNNKPQHPPPLVATASRFFCGGNNKQTPPPPFKIPAGLQSFAWNNNNMSKSNKIMTTNVEQPLCDGQNINEKRIVDGKTLSKRRIDNDNDVALEHTGESSLTFLLHQRRKRVRTELEQRIKMKSEHEIPEGQIHQGASIIEEQLYRNKFYDNPESSDISSFFLGSSQTANLKSFMPRPSTMKDMISSSDKAFETSLPTSRKIPPSAFESSSTSKASSSISQSSAVLKNHLKQIMVSIVRKKLRKEAFEQSHRIVSFRRRLSRTPSLPPPPSLAITPKEDDQCSVGTAPSTTTSTTTLFARICEVIMQVQRLRFTALQHHQQQQGKMPIAVKNLFFNTPLVSSFLSMPPIVVPPTNQHYNNQHSNKYDSGVTTTCSDHEMEDSHDHNDNDNNNDDDVKNNTSNTTTTAKNDTDEKEQQEINKWIQMLQQAEHNIDAYERYWKEQQRQQQQNEQHLKLNSSDHKPMVLVTMHNDNDNNSDDDDDDDDDDLNDTAV